MEKQVVFIDGGAFDGCSIIEAKKCWEGCKVIAFEPLSKNIKVLTELHFDNLDLIQRAVWIKDGVTKFYKGEPESGTILEGKKTGSVNDKNFDLVKTIDFARFCKKKLNPYDYNILKLNIEGAEYDVLKHLHENNLLPLFKEFYIQWHFGKVPSITEIQHKYIQSLIKWKPWEVMVSKKK
jgi:FkbM family methyltransferase